MKRFLLRTSQFLLIQVVIGSILLGSAYVHFRRGYLASMNEKIDLLEASGPPRIIFAGGSSVAFGVDSTQFQSAERKPVNLGLNASLGLDFVAKLVESHVREGDLVVLVPEYELLLGSIAPNEELKRALLRECPRAAPYFADPWPDTKTFLDCRALPEFGCWINQGVRRLPANVRDNVLTKIGLRSEKKYHLYSRQSFDRENGDVVAHHGRAPIGKPDKPPIVNADLNALDAGIQRLNECIKVCRVKNATVVFSYPPISDDRFSQSQPAIQRIADALWSQLDFPILSQPEQVIFAADDFFDAAGHLTYAAKQKHTRTISKGLANYQAFEGVLLVSTEGSRATSRISQGQKHSREPTQTSWD